MPTVNYRALAFVAFVVCYTLAIIAVVMVAPTS